MTNFTSTTTTATIDGVAYQGHSITVDQAEVVFAIKDDPRKLNKALVEATFSIPDAGALPWPAFLSLIEDALDLNGLRPKGESTAAETV